MQKLMQMATGLSARLFAPTTVRALLAGAVVFFLIKAALVSFGAFSMHGPRIGDDSYVYLWFSKSNVFNDFSQSQAVRSIEQFASLSADAQMSAEQRFERDRILLRVPGHAEMFAYALFAPLTATALPFYIQFQIMELCVALFMSLGLFLVFLPEPRPAGLGYLLPLLALAFFPLQGIHFLIPSTLALSFGMMTWGLVLAKRARPLLLLTAGAMAVLSHPIGIAHAGIAGIMVVARAFQAVTPLRRAILEAACLVGVLALYVGLAKFGVTRTDKIANVTSLKISNIPYNIGGLAWHLLNFLRADPFAAAIAITGAIALAKTRFSNFQRIVLFALLTGFALAACIYSLVGYPGEAATRFIVPALLLLFCHAYAAPPHGAENKPLAGILYAAFGLALSAHAVQYAYQQRDGRLPDINRSKLAAALDRIGSGNHILYMETDMALQSALLAGAHNQFTSALGLLQSDPVNAQAWLGKHPPGYVASVIPDQLMASRRLARPVFGFTSYGFPLDGDASLEFTFPALTDEIYLKSEGLGETDFLIVTLAGRECTPGKRNGDGWSRFDLSKCNGLDGARPLTIAIEGKARVTGVSTLPPQQWLHWPWGEAVTWRYGGPHGLMLASQTIDGDFSVLSVEPGFGDPLLVPFLGKLEAYDDTSGIVFWKIR